MLEWLTLSLVATSVKDTRCEGGATTGSSFAGPADGSVKLEAASLSIATMVLLLGEPPLVANCDGKSL
jgi:hypothetical protein